MPLAEERFRCLCSIEAATWAMALGGMSIEFCGDDQLLGGTLETWQLSFEGRRKLGLTGWMMVIGS